jgi:50S ribosomal protein L16 3-hydroxylase
MPGLSALLTPRTYQEFMEGRDLDEPFVVRGPHAPLFTRIAFLRSIEDLFTLWPDRVHAHSPDVADEARALNVSASEARALFRSGSGLHFDSAEILSPVLDLWLQEIRNDLKLSSLTESRCLLYATPKGRGTAPHFDQNLNFVLQLHGTKRWWLAPNKQVENPLTRHTMGIAADAELESYSEPFPKEMPNDSKMVVLEPGSLLYVPRGRWHTTVADSDALSLNFTYSAPSWLDLFGAALRSRLALSAEWRATALTTAQGESDFEALLAELTTDLPNWSASTILEATE